MPLEIERKFLVEGNGWRESVLRSESYRQAYLANNERCSIRIRIQSGQAWLNIKSATLGITRQEFEYPIPAEEGEQILDSFCEWPYLEKTRHFVEHAGHTWEIDEFHGENAPLIVAEIELERVDQTFERPSWLGKEVTDDKRYYNSCLAQNPYSRWSD